MPHDLLGGKILHADYQALAQTTELLRQSLEFGAGERLQHGEVGRLSVAPCIGALRRGNLRHAGSRRSPHIGDVKINGEPDASEKAEPSPDAARPDFGAVGRVVLGCNWRILAGEMPHGASRGVTQGRAAQRRLFSQLLESAKGATTFSFVQRRLRLLDHAGSIGGAKGECQCDAIVMRSGLPTELGLQSDQISEDVHALRSYCDRDARHGWRIGIGRDEPPVRLVLDVASFRH